MCASKRRAGTCLLGLCHVLAILAILSFKRSLSRALSIRDHGQQHRRKRPLEPMWCCISRVQSNRWMAGLYFVVRDIKGLQVPSAGCSYCGIAPGPGDLLQLRRTSPARRSTLPAHTGSAAAGPSSGTPVVRRQDSGLWALLNLNKHNQPVTHVQHGTAVARLWTESITAGTSSRSTWNM